MALSAVSVNPRLAGLQFPWPSLVVSRGNELEELIKQGVSLPFSDIIHAHAGDPQGMGQKPITFFQQVMSLCLEPGLLEDPRYPEDAKLRARALLAECRGKSIGSHTPPAGYRTVRDQVARYLSERDGVPADYRDIFLSSGATDGIRIVLSLLNYSVGGKPPGVMIPIPQYPLFSSTVSEYGMYQISYYLNEAREWAIDIEELKRALEDSRGQCEPRVLVIINPGNPSGFVLSRQDIESIIKFAYEENLFILADEVYQYNVYAEDLQFNSFKKVMMEMGSPYSNMELASFMSGSKGYMGECGARSGFCELVNLDPTVREILDRFLASRICPAALGQVITYCITNPPRPGEPSHEQFVQERAAILQSLKQRADLCYERLNAVPGLSCNKIVGAMYAYPKLDLTPTACEIATKKGLSPDEFYTLELLETTGVCVIPGCLFGQVPGTYHFRLTFLPQESKLKIILERITNFHREFMEKYK